MGQLIIQYRQLYMALPDDDLDSLDLVGNVLQFFIDRLSKEES